MLFRDKRGFSLVELIVVMAIFLTVIMITTSAFNTIVNSSLQQSKSIETQIQGIVGLELLRADLEGAGFGLPWTFSSTSPALQYQEATFTNASTATLFNDAPDNAPRAITSGDSTFNGGSQYLVLKSTLLGASDTAKKSTTVSFGSTGLKTKRVWDAADRDFTSLERVIVVKDSLVTTPPTRQLMASASTVFSATFGNYSTLTNPHQNGDTFEVYGVNPDTDLRMPFNRADYYVKRPTKMPQACAPKTGLLYKAILMQGTTTGGFTPATPLLDCVADMEVVYGLDTSGAGFVNSHTTVPLATAADLRNQLREVRVYILAQEGKKDRLFNYPSTTIDVGESFDGGSTITGRRINLETLIGSDYKHYRWKVYTIVVRPKNLIQ